MRKAIIIKLQEIDILENRIYEALLGPENSDTPFVTVKMMGEDPDVENKHGSIWGFSVFIYDSPNSFTSLDSLVTLVKQKLNKVTLITSLEEQFTPEYIKTLDDFPDEVRKLIMKRVDFDIPAART